MKTRNGFAYVGLIAGVVIVLSFGYLFFTVWQNGINSSMITIAPLHRKAKNVNTNSVANTNSTINTNTSANTNVSTAGWRTFSNTTYNYSLKLDPSWNPVSEMDGHVLSLTDTREGVTLQKTEGVQTGVDTSMILQVCSPRGATKCSWQDLDSWKRQSHFQIVHDANLQAQNFTVGRSDGILNYERNLGTDFITIRVSAAAENLVQTMLSTFTFDETLGWKTYENAQEQFSIRYPSDWTQVDLVSKSVDALTSIVAFRSSKFQKVDNAVGEIYVNRFTNTQNLSLASYWNTVNDLGVSTIPVATTVNGYEAQRLDRLSNSAKFSSPMTKILIKGSGRIYDLSIANVNGNFEQQIETFEKILSTFTISETLGWKTYTNTKYHYSIQYPSNWVASALALSCPPETTPPILSEYEAIGFEQGDTARDCLGPTWPGTFVVYTSTQANGPFFGGATASETKTNVVVDGVKAQRQDGFYNPGGERVGTDQTAFAVVTFSKNSVQYSVVYDNGVGQGATVQEFNTFLSTFTFT